MSLLARPMPPSEDLLTLSLPSFFVVGEEGSKVFEKVALARGYAQGG